MPPLDLDALLKHNAKSAVETRIDKDMLTALLNELAGARRTLQTLRTWMAEYPNDKYSGTWWLMELDRIEKQSKAAPPED